MKFATSGLAIGLVSLTALSSAASAADMPGQRMGGGSYGQAAVPVPAPVPYEEHYKWYVGGGVGYAVRAGSGVTSSADNLTAGYGISVINAEDGPVQGSVFAGRYLTPSMRVELGMDFRAKQKIVTGSHTYQVTYTGDGSLVSPGSTNTNVYDVTHDEKAHLTSNTYMLNAYYEFMPGRTVRPYVGAGVGFATHSLRREFSESNSCNYSENSALGALPAGSCYITAGLPTPGTSVSNAASSLGFGLAASLMAGATVDVGPRTHVDVGYRLMYMGSKTVSALPDSLAGFTTIDIGARTDHEIRTSVRFDLW